MAWDVQARVERRTGRDMDFRIGHMEAWATKQQRIASSARPGATGIQTMLFDSAAFGGLSGREDLVLEALAMQYAELVMSGDLDYLDAVSQSMRDGATVIAIQRNQGLSSEALEAFDEIIAGLADRVTDLLTTHRNLLPEEK